MRYPIQYHERSNTQYLISFTDHSLIYVSIIILLCFVSIGCASLDADQLDSVDDKGNYASNKVWSSLNIPVCWENESAVDLADRQLVRDSVEGTWVRHIPFNFSGWSQCTPSSSGIRIGKSSNGEVSHTKGLGNDLDGTSNGMVLEFSFTQQDASCTTSEQARRNCVALITIHEFGHALGIGHEQNRLDTPSPCKEQQRTHNALDIVVGDWDLHSVMNYCNPQWIGNGRLSQGDIETIKHAYGHLVSGGTSPSTSSTTPSTPNVGSSAGSTQPSNQQRYVLRAGESCTEVTQALGCSSPTNCTLPSVGCTDVLDGDVFACSAAACSDSSSATQPPSTPSTSSTQSGNTSANTTSGLYTAVSNDGCNEVATALGCSSFYNCTYPQGQCSDIIVGDQFACDSSLCGGATTSPNTPNTPNTPASPATPSGNISQTSNNATYTAVSNDGCNEVATALGCTSFYNCTYPQGQCSDILPGDQFSCDPSQCGGSVTSPSNPSTGQSTQTSSQIYTVVANDSCSRPAEALGCAQPVNCTYPSASCDEMWVGDIFACTVNQCP